GAPAVGQVVHVGALESVTGRPIVTAKAFALAAAVDALEPINRLAVLEPLRDAAPIFSSSRAIARPCRGILALGVPVPHPAPELRLEQPAAFIARRCPTDRKRIRLDNVTRPGPLGCRDSRRRRQQAPRYRRAGRYPPQKCFQGNL